MSVEPIGDLSSFALSVGKRERRRLEDELQSRVVDRTATFVFFLGDRFFGTITAYVPGAVAANYHFTSALVVQLLKALAPQLQPLLGTPVNPNPVATVASAAGGNGAPTASAAD